VRKAYPRDDVSIGKGSDRSNPAPDCGNARERLNESDTQTHRILRRGIPFGPVSGSTFESPLDDGFGAPGGADRGLHFISYQTSIVDQFEFITRCWVNNKNFKEKFVHNVAKCPSAVKTISEPLPNARKECRQGGGFDPIIGQNDAGKEGRVREFTIAITNNDNGDREIRQVSTADVEENRRDWVIPTGGGYFLSPSITALRILAS
jgi:deferrochelatase/peroxidase EfeB